MLWETKGPENTIKTVEAALKRAGELEVKNIVVASNTGKTAELFLDKGFVITNVTHQYGFKSPGENEMTSAMKKKLTLKGVQILTATHLLAGVDRGIRLKFGGLYPAEIIASTLRIFGQGVKVCTEIACMALDAGLIPYGEEIVSVAGSGRGADTACVIIPAHSQHFFDTIVKEIICMPREK